MTVVPDGSLWSRLADLTLEIEDYGLERLEQAVSSGFTRVSTVIRLHGDGHEGLGEDVGYDAGDQEAQLAAGPSLPLAGSYTLAGFSSHLATLDLWPEPARQSAAVDYRRWAYESAALDLALRQAGIALHEALGREPEPLTFVVSTRLGEPATAAPVHDLRDRIPGLCFKLDPTSDWDDALIADLAATGAVLTADFKGLYHDTVVDSPPDPGLYRRIAEAFPAAWLEDPALTPATRAVLEPHHERVTWDANIHSVTDIEALPWVPRAINIKPSRFGPVAGLLAAYEFCTERGIAMYGGGQFELGVGRGQIQYLASIFHPRAPNDVAPAVFNLTDRPARLPAPPLAPQPQATGFRWG